MTLFHLEKTKWSTLRKAALVEDLSLLTKVDVKVLGRLRKPLTGHLSRQSNPLEFKAEKRAQRRLDRLLVSRSASRHHQFNIRKSCMAQWCGSRSGSTQSLRKNVSM